MKSKSIFIICLLFTTLLLCQCKKEKSSITLPSITQIGANTFGCKINGTVWVPYFQCTPFISPCSEIQTIFDHPGNNILPLIFQIGLLRSNKVNNEGSFYITNLALLQRPPRAISAPGNIYDSININCNLITSVILITGFLVRHN